MKLHRAVKTTAAVLAGLTILAGGALVALLVASTYKSDRIVPVQAAAVPYRTEPASVENGKYLFDSRGCGDCHGADGAGAKVIDDPGGFLVKAPNITLAAGSVTEKYAEADWVRAIRHGVKPSGRPLLIMPSEDYNRLTDGDLADLVAYVRQLPRKPGGEAVIRMPMVVQVIYALGILKDAAEKIDHTLPPSTPVAAADTVEHGAYVANACIGCHGRFFAGGRIPGTPPDWPPAANLTPAHDGVMANYPDAEIFRRMIRTGVRPDGGKVSRYMPLNALRNMNDVDLDAVYRYLLTLQAVPTGTR